MRDKLDLTFQSSNGRVITGLAFIASGVISFLLFFFAAILSKLLPPFQNEILHAIQNDRSDARPEGREFTSDDVDSGEHHYGENEELNRRRPESPDEERMAVENMIQEGREEGGEGHGDERENLFGRRLSLEGRGGAVGTLVQEEDEEPGSPECNPSYDPTSPTYCIDSPTTPTYGAESITRDRSAYKRRRLESPDEERIAVENMIQEGREEEGAGHEDERENLFGRRLSPPGRGGWLGEEEEEDEEPATPEYYPSFDPTSPAYFMDSPTTPSYSQERRLESQDNEERMVEEGEGHEDEIENLSGRGLSFTGFGGWIGEEEEEDEEPATPEHYPFYDLTSPAYWVYSPTSPLYSQESLESSDNEEEGEGHEDERENLFGRRLSLEGTGGYIVEEEYEEPATPEDYYTSFDFSRSPVGFINSPTTPAYSQERLESPDNEERIAVENGTQEWMVEEEDEGHEDERENLFGRRSSLEGTGGCIVEEEYEEPTTPEDYYTSFDFSRSPAYFMNSPTTPAYSQERRLESQDDERIAVENRIQEWRLEEGEGHKDERENLFVRRYCRGGYIVKEENEEPATPEYYPVYDPTSPAYWINSPTTPLYSAESSTTHRSAHKRRRLESSYNEEEVERHEDERENLSGQRLSPKGRGGKVAKLVQEENDEPGSPEYNPSSDPTSPAYCLESPTTPAYSPKREEEGEGKEDERENWRGQRLHEGRGEEVWRGKLVQEKIDEPGSPVCSPSYDPTSPSYRILSP